MGPRARYESHQNIAFLKALGGSLTAPVPACSLVRSQAPPFRMPPAYNKQLFAAEMLITLEELPR